jgi:D-glycero-D-manno-heptose 1,7-bisphosphate phosphatase
MPDKAVFLDRDGVINRAIVRDRKPFPPQDLSEFVWMDGIHETLRALHARGYVLVVFTNQPDIARGTQTQQQLDQFHARILNELPIARIYACVHDDADQCDCRKPKPGMLMSASSDFDLDLSRSWVVGDRWRDIEAGRAAGCRTVLIQHGYDERAAIPDHTIRRIPELLDIIEP